MDNVLKITHQDPNHVGALLIVEGDAQFETITGVFDTPVVETDTIKFDDLWLTKYEHTRDGTFNPLGTLYSSAVRVKFNDQYQLALLNN